MALIPNKEIKHPACGGIAFYSFNIPMGRAFLPLDAFDDNGNHHSVKDRVQCLSCGKNVDLQEVTDYYNE